MDHICAAHDAFAVPAGIDEVLGMLKQHRDSTGEVQYREISLEEAAARWRAAFEVTDMTLDPPTSEDLDHLRALVTARLAKLPSSGEIPDPVALSENERDRLLADFFNSDEASGLWGISGDTNEDGAVEHLAHQIMTFSLDYAVGSSLRFSPVLVEVFCLDWAPRKIAIDGDGFTLLPDVLAAWIRFVGRRRGVPEESIKAAVDAIYEYAPEMIELSQDPKTWGPAKTMTLAIQQRDIDLTDHKALDSFIAEVNNNGGIDVLANSLVESVAPRR